MFVRKGFKPLNIPLISHYIINPLFVSYYNSLPREFESCLKSFEFRWPNNKWMYLKYHENSKEHIALTNYIYGEFEIIKDKNTDNISIPDKHLQAYAEFTSNFDIMRNSREYIKTKYNKRASFNYNNIHIH